MYWTMPGSQFPVTLPTRHIDVTSEGQVSRCRERRRDDVGDRKGALTCGGGRTNGFSPLGRGICSYQLPGGGFIRSSHCKTLRKIQFGSIPVNFSGSIVISSGRLLWRIEHRKPPGDPRSQERSHMENSKEQEISGQSPKLTFWIRIL